MPDIFCAQEAPDYVQLECGAELGGVIAVGFIDPDQEVDENNLAASLELASWWTNGQEVSPQTHWVVTSTRGSLPAGSPTEEEGFGLIPTERTGDDRELSFEALAVMDNRDFWATINKRRNHKMVYVTAGQDENGNYNAFYVSGVSVYASEVIDQSIKSRIRYAVSAKWSTAMTPSLPFSAPASIFAV